MTMRKPATALNSKGKTVLIQIIQRQVASSRRVLGVPHVFLICSLLLAAACSKKPEVADDILPVRVGGKIITYQVDVGTVFRRDQVLMRRDPKDLHLAQAQAIVTEISAEVGQLVAAGTPTTTSLAPWRAKEVVVGVPENMVDKLRVSGAADPAPSVLLRRADRCDCAVRHEHR